MFPDVEEVEQHLLNSGGIGIIPASIGMVTVDVDVPRYYGMSKLTEWSPPTLLWQSTSHWNLPDYKKTRDMDRLGSYHALYKVGQGFRQVLPNNWNWRGMSGQLLHDRHHNRIPVPLTNIPQLHKSLSMPITKFPMYIVQQSPFLSSPKRDRSKPVISKATPGDTLQDTIPHTCTRVDTLAALTEGERNTGLFNYLRTWAHTHRSSGLDDLVITARWARTQMADLTDFPIGEADAIAGSVWKYRESGRLLPAYTKEQQARGGRVKAERVNAANSERDDYIRELAAGGMSLRKIAAMVNLGKSRVANIVRREHGNG